MKKAILLMFCILVQVTGCGGGGNEGGTDMIKVPGYTLCGTQRDAAGNQVAGATVSLVVNSKVYKADTSATGEYSLVIPATDAASLPDSFTYTVTKTGYIPLTYVRIRTDPTCQDSLPLMPVDNSAVSVETDPLPHHLGNGNFSGVINSKFQYPTPEGMTFTKEFSLTSQPLDYASATITFVHKGVESSSYLDQLVVNGQSWLIPNSDPSGDYTPFSLTVPTAVFTMNGANTVTIASGVCVREWCAADYDDFEFQNIGIQFNK